MLRVSNACLIFLVILKKCAGVDYRDVITLQGPVRGYKEGNIFVFYSIQYATAPSGRNFYKAPLPPPTWNTTFEATEQNIICQQPIEVADPPPGYQVKDQCLIVNIFVPENVTKPLPVVIYIHGGGFQIGSGNRLTPRKLVGNGKVIAVTFNYRLGPRGFLCLGTETAPGNAAMKDAIELLKWVQKNIYSFGGNPKEVTVAGYSAGAAAADVLLLSKMSDGLVNKGIIESGANLDPFAVQIDPLENAKWFAKSLGFNDTNNITALEEFYLNTPYEILSYHTAFLLSRPDSSVVFAPCVESNIGYEMFLDKSPLEILESGNFRKLPLLYGITHYEGLRDRDFRGRWLKKMNESFVDFVPQDMGHSKADRIKLGKILKQYYYGSESVSYNNFMKYIDFFSDIVVKYGLIRAARLQKKAGNDQIYFYEYRFVDDDQQYIPYTNYRGAKHCAQTHAVLDLHVDEDLISDKYKKVKVFMRDLWANFITYGKPVPEGYIFPKWPPMSSIVSHMVLDTTSEYKDRYVYKNWKFLDTIMNHYYKYPSSPNPNVDNSYIYN